MESLGLNAAFTKTREVILGRLGSGGAAVNRASARKRAASAAVRVGRCGAGAGAGAGAGRPLQAHPSYLEPGMVTASASLAGGHHAYHQPDRETRAVAVVLLLTN